MLANIFLNLKRPNPAGRMVAAVCAINGAPGLLHGIGRTFNDVEEAAAALAGAGIPDHRYTMALTAVKAGYGSFLEITEEEADALNVLHRRLSHG